MGHSKGLFKKKGTSGEATKYMTRNVACKKLQIRLVDFRKLCILKGIYPREPKSRKKAQKGSTEIKALYLRKDIDFLALEPIIWTLRKEKTHATKVKKCRSENEYEQLRRLQRHKPTYQIDHLVLERYPDFVSALQELDDALSSVFLYASLAKSKSVPDELTSLCKRMAVEFMLYCIQSRALRKVFVTIKGYYYRAIIQGEEVTWVIPHPYRPEAPRFVDMSVFTTFINFYTTFMGFVNFKLYQSINLHYPPKLSDVSTELPKRHRKNKKQVQELHSLNINTLNTLNGPLKVATGIEDDQDDDNYDMSLMSHNEEFKKGVFISQTQEVEANLQRSLFEGKKFFLGREINRESLTFVIRSAGGLVSWDESADFGSTYKEDDQEISFEISDRPTIVKKYLSRYYIQPQWVYDSFNAGIHMPVQKYFVGEELPPHTSPFDEVNDLYRKISPEELQLKALKNAIQIVGHDRGGNDVSSEEEDDDEMVVADEEDDDSKNSKSPWKDLSDEQKATRRVTNRLDTIEIKKCLPYDRFDEANKKRQDTQDFKLAASFIHRKQKRLFKKILAKEKTRRDRAEGLKRKRILYEKEMARRRNVDAKQKGTVNSELKGDSEKSVDEDVKKTATDKVKTIKMDVKKVTKKKSALKGGPKAIKV